MSPSLLPGDYVLVEKVTLGARIFNVLKSFKKEDATIYRIPGIGKVERNDILVFNFPYPDKDNNISFDLMTFHIKRCVGLPGDTLKIVDAHYMINNIVEDLGNWESQEYLSTVFDKLKGFPRKAYPRDSVLRWNIKNMGPLFVPSKNSRIVMDRNNAVIYKPLIEWEQKNKIYIRREGVFLGSDKIESYVFENDYYFVAGDNLMNSHDSRYWGMLPESFIAGRACLIWKSVEMDTGRFRWDRMIKQI